jgi:predicted phage terminase large subunit-like protein
MSKAEFTFMYVDPADEGGDHNAAPVCYLVGNGIYIPQVIFNKNGTDINIPDIVELICSQKLHAAEIEGNSAWILFGKDIRNKVEARYQDAAIRIIKNTANKKTRIQAQAAFIKNHFYFRQDYDSFHEYRSFIKALTGYLREGQNAHDDAPDALAGCANYFKNNFGHLW